MKYSVLVVFLQLFVISVSAQEISRPLRLKSGTFTRSKNLRNEVHLTDSLKGFHFKNRYYTLIQFNKLPDIAERQALAREGILLYNYVPDNTFLAEINDQLGAGRLKKNNISGVYTMDAKAKISPALERQLKQPMNDPDKLIAVSFYGNIDKATAITELKRAGAQISETKIQPAHVIFINATAPVVEKIASLPFVAYVSSQHMKPVALNYKNRGFHAVNALSASVGRNLQGSNVTVGVGDDGDASTHIDIAGRLINRNPMPASIHATHTTGIVTGAGIINPKLKGMAPKTTVVGQYYSDILTNTPYYATDFGMVITNNSYQSAANGCAGEGEYDVLSYYVDAQMNNDPALLHIFSSGNDGSLTCSPYPRQFATVKSGFQSGKNVLTVGASGNTSYVIGTFSSCGPVQDGRIKPEIVAGGYNIFSTINNNGSATYSGTSMASPTVAGAIALLYERYRQLHGGTNPSSALIKAVTCNSAEDLGNPGPDFIFGFGNLNALNAVQTIEGNNYFTGTLNNGGSSTFTIPSIPSGTAKIKVMLYWNDPEAMPYAATTLVNNLDLRVTTSDATVHYPLILDPTAANVNNVAVEGIDNRNNIEQVVINNPPAGNCTITVNGTGIPQGPQDYVVVYQIVQPGVTVEYPFGEETLVPGELEYIRWNATDPNTSNFTLEYSIDNGSTWTIIDNNVSATSRTYLWTVPSVVSNTALIRASRNGTSYTDVSDFNFSILGTTTLTASNTCPGYASLSWSSISSATSYDIMMLKGSEMQVVGNTTATSFLLAGLNKDSTYYLAVRGVNGTTPGRRSLAQTIIPSGGACASPTFDNDLTPNLLIAPVTGRMYTSSQLGIAAPQVSVKNLGSVASSGSFNISYQVNGGATVTETSTQSIAANSTYTYTFTNTFNFATPGTYSIKVWVDLAGDGLHANDTLVTVIKNLRNDLLILSPSYTEGFESATSKSYYTGTLGFDGLDRCDFNASNSNGRARTFVNTGIAHTGNRAITLDLKTNNGVSTADSLITTFNLGNYSATDQLWLSFYVQNHGIDFSAAGNRVWIRGSETSAWIPVYTLPYNSTDIGIYRGVTPINITETLANAVPAQTVSTSFQIKFGEQGFRSTNSVIADGNTDDGYTFDDVTITLATDDMAMMQLVNPATTNVCALSANESITVQVKNYSSVTLTNVPVSYRINNGAIVTESIGSIAAGQVMNYTFMQTADLSAYRQDTITTWVRYATDDYSTNDTLTYTFHTTPHITSYPYLEGFEGTDAGNWYAGGINSSWQCGIPAGTVINKAANGTKAWVTNLTGNYNNNEVSYLYSPCFNLTGLTQPVLSFSHIFRTEDNCYCDFHWVEYSTNGQNWFQLGSVGSGTNWHENTMFNVWKNSVARWQVSSIDIPVTGDMSRVRFRIAMYSDPGVTYEGVGIDDIHVFDKAAVYSGANITSGLTQTVSGNNWIHFNSGGNRVVSINPNGQNLGSTDVRVYINTGGVRNDGNQYYLDRNIVIQPTNVPTAPVSVRYYFLNTEANNLINATGCSSCTTISDAFAAGVTQYSYAPAEENGTLSDNGSGVYEFITPSQVNVIPYDNGYYAEYQVSHFSEFWINNGGAGANQPLPMVLGIFTVTKNNSTALLQWTTLQEVNTDHFIIERSTDGINYVSIGTLPAGGNTIAVSKYHFTDEQPATGINYYRIKIADKNAKSSYSPVRKINIMSNDFTISLLPNPVTKGVVHINSSVNCTRIELRDATGRLIKTAKASGMQNQLPVQDVAKGIYLVTVVTDSGKKVEKIFIE
jgi:hypothetical protein